MSEYKILTKHGDFKYPTTVKFPEGEKNYFEDHIPTWNEYVISKIKEGKPEDYSFCAIEVGALHGGCSTWLLETLLKNPAGFLHCIDINETEYLKHNLSLYNNVKLHKGLSTNILSEFWHENKEPFADLVYIDGSHISKHVLEDAVLSWKLLKIGGIMVFDDYGWGIDSPVDCKPKTAIDAFLSGYQKHYEVIGAGWQVYLRKIDYKISDDDLSSNYAYSGNEHFNKTSY
jgi:hypothetical protein